MDILLTPMTKELCRQYYKEFEADPDIYMDMSLFTEFTYSDDWADAHYNRQLEKKRIYLAVMYENKPVGEVTLKDVDYEKMECTLGIHLQNDKYKGLGIGTRAEKLALQYAFGKLGMKAVNADVVLKNKRSQHVLEKIGFQYVKEDEMFKYYRTEATKQVILLNGPSSSGKSTLARNLQKEIKNKKNQTYTIVSIDDFLKMTTDETLYEDDVFEISLELCEKGLELLESEDGIIIDHVITSERIYKQLLEKFKDYQLHSVQVTCPLEVLRQREIERHNRCVGSAEASYEYLYPKEGYDLSIDTYHMTQDECAQKINELLG